MLAYLNEMTSKDYLSLSQKEYELIAKLYSVILANMSQSLNQGPMLKEILDDTSLFRKVISAVKQIQDAQVKLACMQSLDSACDNAYNIAAQYQ